MTTTFDIPIPTRLIKRAVLLQTTPEANGIFWSSLIRYNKRTDKDESIWHGTLTLDQVMAVLVDMKR